MWQYSLEFLLHLSVMYIFSPSKRLYIQPYDSPQAFSTSTIPYVKLTSSLIIYQANKSIGTSLSFQHHICPHICPPAFLSSHSGCLYLTAGCVFLPLDKADPSIRAPESILSSLLLSTHSFHIISFSLSIGWFPSHCKSRSPSPEKKKCVYHY